jgi:hypothetical protein
MSAVVWLISALVVAGSVAVLLTQQAEAQRPVRKLVPVRTEDERPTPRR